MIYIVMTVKIIINGNGSSHKNMISFKKYYLQQIKDVPVIWKLAKKQKKIQAFISSISLLLFPKVIYIMWLYDTGQMKIDKRFCKEGTENE